MGNLLLIFAVLTFILYLAFVKIVLPAFWRSRAYRKFEKRLSRSIRRLFFAMRDDIFAHLVTLCEPDGDEPFEPYLDSPLRTCPPCTFVDTPPKQEANNNNLTPSPAPPPPPPPTGRRGRVRGRAWGMGRNLARVLPLQDDVRFEDNVEELLLQVRRAIDLIEQVGRLE